MPPDVEVPAVSTEEVLVVRLFAPTPRKRRERTTCRHCGTKASPDKPLNVFGECKVCGMVIAVTGRY